MTAPRWKLAARTPRASSLRSYLARFRRRLHEPRFWAVQGFVVLATALHGTAEAAEAITDPDELHLFVVAMYGFYAVPIVYAGLNFGREGAVPTAVWAGLLALPNVLIWHDGYERVAEVLQHVLIFGLALIVAGRVDREVAARRQAEQAAAARRRSEARYRTLFEAAGEAILVFDLAGRIHEANAAAEALFGRSGASLRGRRLAEVLGAEETERLLARAAGAGCGGGEVRLPRPDGAELWLEPVCGRVSAEGGDVLIQALFRDVTDQRHRRQGLEAYARQIVAAQEDERRRIARDLHDGPLQGLILLHRRLDDLAGGGEAARATPAGGLEAARRAVEAIADEVRRVSRDLRPSILDDLGLEPAVRWLVKDLERRTGIRGRFVAEGGDRRLDRQAELGLFRIAQEALRNAERHAGATEVAVALTVDEDEARLVVKDNGRGMATAEVGPGTALTGKLGLLGMRERARLCGGTLSIVTAPGRGTRVDVTIPASSHERRAGGGGHALPGSARPLSPSHRAVLAEKNEAADVVPADQTALCTEADVPGTLVPGEPGDDMRGDRRRQSDR